MADLPLPPSSLSTTGSGTSWASSEAAGDADSGEPWRAG